MRAADKKFLACYALRQTDRGCKISTSHTASALKCTDHINN